MREIATNGGELNEPVSIEVRVLDLPVWHAQRWVRLRRLSSYFWSTGYGVDLIRSPIISQADRVELISHAMRDQYIGSASVSVWGNSVSVRVVDSGTASHA